MIRYLRTWKLFWGAAIGAEMEYRINFFLGVLTALANLLGSIYISSLFYQDGQSLGDWPWENALIVIGLFTFFEGMSSTVFSANLSKIITHVQEGTLDFVLLKPIDSQFWLSFRNLSPWGIPNIVLGLGLIIYAGINREIPFTIGQYLVGIIPVCFGLMILYGIWFILGTLSIWFVKIYNVTEVLRTFMAAGRFPIDAFSPALRFFFTVFMPIAYLTTAPANIMLGDNAGHWIFWSAFIAVVLLLFSRWFWKFALKFYTSASS